MPFSKVDDFEQSFPAIKDLTAEQKKVALEVFNSSKDSGDDDETAIKKAIGSAKKLSEEMTELLHKILLSEVTDEALTSQEFEILKVGQYHDPRYGKFAVDEALLNELAENFNSGKLETEVAVDVNHDSSRGAIAWIKSLSVRAGKLYATLKDFSEEGKKLLKEKIFKYFSVEFAPLEKVDQSTGRRFTVKNVLRGLAVTNRPVIKGMRPAFFSESLQFNDPLSMETFKLFAELLSKKKAVSKDELATFKAMHAKLSEDEQKETQSQVTDAEKKVEDEAKAAADAKAKEEADAKAKADADAAAAGAQGGVSAAEFAELKRQNSEKDKRLAQLELAETERENTKRVEGLMLSEAGRPGFVKTPEMVKKLSEFVSTLSPAQYVQFSDIMGDVRVLSETQLSEIGHSKSGAQNGEKTLAEEDAALAKDIKAYMEKNPKATYREAMLACQDAMKE